MYGIICRAVLAFCVCGLDHFRTDGNRAAAFAEAGTGPDPAISCLGISLDTVDFPGSWSGSDSQSLDRAAGSIIHWFASDSGGSSLLLPMARRLAARFECRAEETPLTRK